MPSFLETMAQKISMIPYIEHVTFGPLNQDFLINKPKKPGHTKFPAFYTFRWQIVLINLNLNETLIGKE